MAGGLTNCRDLEGLYKTFFWMNMAHAGMMHQQAEGYHGEMVKWCAAYCGMRTTCYDCKTKLPSSSDPQPDP